MSRESRYYIAEFGPIREAAEKFRQDYIKWTNEAYELLREDGGVSVRTNFAGKVSAIEFKGKPPEGWKKPDKYNCSWPFSKNKEGFELLNRYPLQPLPGAYFKDVVFVPHGISWESPSGKSFGAMYIGNHIKPISVAYYHAESPLLIVLPDVKSAIKSILGAYPGAIIPQEILDWTPPEGLKEILREEWDFWQAKYKAEKGETA